MAVAHLVTTLNEALEVGDSVWKIYKFRRLVNRCWIQLFFLFLFWVILGYLVGLQRLFSSDLNLLCLSIQDLSFASFYQFCWQCDRRLMTFYCNKL